MLKKIGSAVVAFAPLSVLAAVPASVTTAISDAQADAVSVAGLMLGVTAALLAFTLMRRQMH